MKKGAVLVDISIDQGGCFETSHETKHSDPVYTVDGVLHYAVGNIPGAVPRTSTIALTNVTLPFVRVLADHGVDGDPASTRVGVGHQRPRRRHRASGGQGRPFRCLSGFAP